MTKQLRKRKTMVNVVRSRLRSIIGAICMYLFFISCSDDNISSVGGVQYKHTCKVAVLMRDGEKERWERTAEWACRNIKEAQRGLAKTVELELTFKSQDDSDINEYIQRLATDTTIAAIVGPTTSEHAEQMGTQLASRPLKPMITPSATGVEYQRRFSNANYVWNMAESDIAQLEVILSRVAGNMSLNGNETQVFLLAKDDGEGQTVRNAYAEWFGFIAGEYSLDVGGVFLYKTEDDVRSCVRQLCGTDYKQANNVLVFNPSDNAVALAFDDEVGRLKSEIPPNKFFYMPQVYCSDAFVSDQIAVAVHNGVYEGVDLYVSPESGFGQAYKQLFGEDLSDGEGQFYDALCLVAYAATYSSATGQCLNDAILSVVEGKEGAGRSWLPADMRYNFEQLQSGVCPNIDGVSSSWTFDEKTHSCVVGSTFRHWRLSDKQFVTMEYVSVEGDRHSSSSKNMWEWTNSRMQTFNREEGSGLLYPNLKDRWALLVAGSKGWSNYRFQSDVFAVYKLLRESGYQDDHIVLIAEDDVANNTHNPLPGTLFVSLSGENVYVPSAIDYRLSELSSTDIGDILQGKKSERLTQVINVDYTDNIFIFWSGHGSPGALDFGDNQQLTYRQMREMLANVPHRKLLFTVEACYSGGLGEYCEGMPGMLFITAANPYETSHADVWSEAVGVYLSNGFTRGFLEAVTLNRAILLRDLYYTLAQTTYGSHVTIYNIANYGNVYTNTMGEFLN